MKTTHYVIERLRDKKWVEMWTSARFSDNSFSTISFSTTKDILAEYRKDFSGVNPKHFRLKRVVIVSSKKETILKN